MKRVTASAPADDTAANTHTDTHSTSKMQLLVTCLSSCFRDMFCKKNPKRSGIERSHCKSIFFLGFFVRFQKKRAHGKFIFLFLELFLGFKKNRAHGKFILVNLQHPSHMQQSNEPSSECFEILNMPNLVERCNKDEMQTKVSLKDFVVSDPGNVTVYFAFGELRVAFWRDDYEKKT